MASIKKASTLLKRMYLNNLSADEGLTATLLLNGPHGIGKSQVVKEAANELKGYAFVVEASALKEGELTGLPVASQAKDGSTEVRFVKYYLINKIHQLEKYYFEKATHEGFLGGRIKLAIDGEGNKYLVNGKEKTLVGSRLDDIKNGEDNAYKFGSTLSPEDKLELVESGEIKPVFLFIDELNRTEMQTMKEMMNIILNRTVNGYELPWWVNIVSAVNPCSQNSTYATNELDDAQLDRFLKIRVEANLDEWTDYALDKGLNSDVIEAIAIADGIFIHREKGQEDTSEMSPSPRSWEMVSHIYDTINKYNESKFFSNEERKAVNEDLRILIRGKVGETAARTFLENIARKENNIKPTEIINGKDSKVTPEVVEKFKRQKRLTQKIISDNVASYIVHNFAEFEKGKTSTDPKKKESYNNIMAQLKEFVTLLDIATQILFVKKILKAQNGTTLFTKIAKAFSVEVLQNITEMKGAIKDLTKE